jgi:hypothetical protein
MKASYPNPKPQSMGPNSRIQKTFQQLFLDSAIEPVMHMKKRIVSRG